MTPPPTGPITSRNQMATPPAITMTTPPSHGSIYHQNQITTPPTMAPQTMDPPSLSPSTTPPAMAPPSTDPSDFQMTLPTTVVSPFMTPVTMTPPTMSRPSSMGATPPTPSSQDFQNPMCFTTPPSMMAPSTYDYTWNDQYGTWDMAQKAGGAPVPQRNVNQGVDDYQNSQQFGKPGNGPQNNLDFSQYDGAGTSSQSVVSPPNNLVTPPSMTAPPAHNYTMNQHWNLCGTWDMSQMGVPPPPPQWEMMHEAAELGHPGSIPNDFPQRTHFNETGTSSQQGWGDFQNFSQLDIPGTVPQNNNEADTSFLQRSSGVDFDFRF